MAGDSVSFEKFVERAYRGIPERTLTIEEKERAIRAKKKILKKFSAMCGIDKRFSIDRNRDGFQSNVEMNGWDIRCTSGKNLEGALSNDELAKKFNMKEESLEDMQRWPDSEIEDLKSEAKNMYGVELS